MLSVVSLERTACNDWFILITTDLFYLNKDFLLAIFGLENQAVTQLYIEELVLLLLLLLGAGELVPEVALDLVPKDNLSRSSMILPEIS